MAMMQGNSGASMDVPPYCIVADINRLCGLNSVGLRRSGMSAEERNELRRVYHRIFLRTNERLQEVLDAIDEEIEHEPARQFVQFVRDTKRGLCSHGGRE